MSLPSEEWRPVVGYEGCYEVSDRGRVRSIARTMVRPTTGRPVRVSPRILRSTQRTRYAKLVLHREGVRRAVNVHTLVLTAFVGPVPEGMEACHNDGDPQNNRLSNLRWDTKSGNNRDRVRHGTHPMARRTRCPRGHALAVPNLRAAVVARGFRGCLACGRTYHLAQKAADRGEPFDFQAVSDAHYERIMRAA